MMCQLVLIRNIVSQIGNIVGNVYIHLIYLYTCACNALYTYVGIENI